MEVPESAAKAETEKQKEASNVVIVSKILRHFLDIRELLSRSFLPEIIPYHGAKKNRLPFSPARYAPALPKADSPEKENLTTVTLPQIMGLV